MPTIVRPQGNLIESLQSIVEALADLGLQAITDPRNARPNAVLVELPTVNVYTTAVTDITVVIRCLAPPPGNDDAANYLMTLADKIINSPIAIVDARPGYATYGNQELPTYDLTCRVAVNR